MYYSEQLGNIQIEMLFTHWNSVNVGSQDIWNTKQSALAANAGADTSKREGKKLNTRVRVQMMKLNYIIVNK